MKLNITIWLIIINLVVFLAQYIAYSANLDFIKTTIETEDLNGKQVIINCVPGDQNWDVGCDAVSDILALNMKILVTRGYFWQIFTYMFVHGSFYHIFFNMFGLMVFGPKIELTMGKDRYLKYYIICGICSSLFYMLITTVASGISSVPMLGASGAIFGVLTAYGLMYPRDTIYVQFFIPMPAIVFVIFYGIIQLIGGVASLLTPAGGGIAYFGHVGGMIAGVILIKYLDYGRRRIRYFWE
jgi:membrane associated rhomboid family serine protease